MAFIDESLRSAIFNSAIAAEKSKNFDKAASSFSEFAKMFPQDKNADRALYNSSVNQFKAGKIEDSIATQKRLLSVYPKSIIAPDVLASMAETYEAIARFELAAEAYKRFAQTYPNDKRAPISLYNTGVLYRGVKRMDLAATAFSELYHKYPNHPAANDAVFESARIRESTGDIKGAISDYDAFTTSLSNKGTDQALFASAKSSSLRLSEDPKNERARRDFGKTIGALKVKNGPAAPAARYTVAKILFEEQENNVRAFKNIALNSGKDIERQAAAKQSKLERMAAAYQEVIAIGNAEFSVASYFRLGELHEDFANSLFNAPPPAGASQKQAAEFKSQLEKAGFPLKDEAYKFFEMAYQQSSNADTFTPWSQKTYQKMVQLAPEKNPVIDDQSASPGYMSFRVALNPATSVLAE